MNAYKQVFRKLASNYALRTKVWKLVSDAGKKRNEKDIQICWLLARNFTFLTKPSEKITKKNKLVLQASFNHSQAHSYKLFFSMNKHIQILLLFSVFVSVSGYLSFMFKICSKIWEKSDQEHNSLLFCFVFLYNEPLLASLFLVFVFFWVKGIILISRYVLSHCSSLFF